MRGCAARVAAAAFGRRAPWGAGRLPAVDERALLAGALHGLYDLDVASPSGTTIASTNKDGAPSEKGIAADHHCHGCFSVSMPAPMTAAADLKPARDIVIPLEIQRRGLAPGIDPPPPKFLT